MQKVACVQLQIEPWEEPYKQTMVLSTQKTQKYHSSLLPHGAHAVLFSIMVMNVRPFNFLFQFW